MYLYTLQAPMRGYSYITKWDINNNFKPIETNSICDVTCGIMEYSDKLETLAVGTSDGRLICVDAR